MRDRTPAYGPWLALAALVSVGAETKGPLLLRIPGNLVFDKTHVDGASASVLRVGIGDGARDQRRRAGPCRDRRKLRRASRSSAGFQLRVRRRGRGRYSAQVTGLRSPFVRHR